MRKVVDAIFFSVLLFLLIFCWSLYFTRNLWISAGIGAFAAVLANLLWFGISQRFSKTGSLSRTELFRLLSVMGPEESTALLFSTLPVEDRSDFSPPFFVYKGDTLVFNNIKFSPTSEEDIARLYRACKAKNFSKVLLIAGRTDRKLLAFAASLGLSVRCPTPITIKRYLQQHNALPEPPSPLKIKLPKYKIKDLLSVVFDRQKAKYYIFTGVLLLLMSLITPLRLYYLIFASVPMALAILSFFVRD
jgi:hypothetical protein